MHLYITILGRIKMNIREKLLELTEPSYGDFQARLVPNIPREDIIGIRVPKIRALAKELKGSEDIKAFRRTLPHKYYEENLLHIISIEDIKDYEECMAEIKAFLPYMNCWAVTDNKVPKVLTKNRDRLITEVLNWIQSPESYICRFGLHMLMSQFLDEDFRTDYLKLASTVRSCEYYVNMMNAWLFATALAKKWDATIPYLENNRLDKWTHNMTIRKAIESYRITEEQKTYLRTLKIQ